jgi:hypothetical protein
MVVWIYIMVLGILENGLVGDSSLAPAQLDLVDSTIVPCKGTKLRQLQQQIFLETRYLILEVKVCLLVNLSN